MKYLVYLIICLLLFSLFRKVVKRIFPKLGITKEVISGILAVILAPFIAKAIFIIFFNLLLYEYHPERHFNGNSWQENVQDRHEMANNLIESQVLLNKTKEQIAEKIGLPNDKIILESDTLSKWNYDMGNRSWGFGLKFYYLNIEFENDKSTKVKIREAID